MPCASPDGKILDLFGQALVPANRSAARVVGKAKAIPATFGLTSDALSPNARLQSCLENRLQARMAAYGSPECNLIWKRWPISARPPICALRASARRTSDSGSTGWPTPTCPSNTGGNHQSGNNRFMAKTRSIPGAWPSPKASNTTGIGQRGEGGANLQTVAAWATPRANKRGTLDSHGDKQTPLSVQTEKPGALSPEHSRWLMGYPVEWTKSADTATPLSRKSRQSSSKRRAKP